MSVYRITRFAASDMDKASEHVESVRSKLQSTGCEFIDIVDYGNGKGVVVAKYPDEATMEAATSIAKEVFGEMVQAGLIDGDSIHPHTGKVRNSF